MACLRLPVLAEMGRERHTGLAERDLGRHGPGEGAADTSCTWGWLFMAKLPMSVWGLERCKGPVSCLLWDDTDSEAGDADVARLEVQSCVEEARIWGPFTGTCGESQQHESQAKDSPGSESVGVWSL